ncbi:MAG: hypothetical protein ACRBK7_16760 [Acidimicrobiales bacterium]
MFIDDELEAAGRRVANNPVEAPPMLGDLQQEVRRRRNNVRFFGAVSVAAVMLLGGGATALLRLDDQVQVVSASPAPEGLANDSESSEASIADSDGGGPSSGSLSDEEPSESEPLSSQSSDEKSKANGHDSSFHYEFDSESNELSAQFGTWWTSTEYAVGDEAEARAADAAAAADEVRSVDGNDVWIERFKRDDGTDGVSVSTLRDGRFVMVSGPADLEDKLVDSVSATHDDQSGWFDKDWPAFPQFAPDFTDLPSPPAGIAPKDWDPKDWDSYAEKWEEYGKLWEDWADERFGQWGDHAHDDESDDSDESNDKSKGDDEASDHSDSSESESDKSEESSGESHTHTGDWEEWSDWVEEWSDWADSFHHD